MAGKAFFWSADKGGSGFYRMQLPSWILGKLNVEVKESSYYISSFTKNATVVGQRVANPAPSSRWLEMCERPDTVTVYDIDDNYFAVDPLSPTAHQFFSQPSVQNRIVENAKAADYITTCSDALTKVMQEKCPDSRVITIPNGLPLELLSWESKQRDRIVIGWVGSAQTWFELKPIVPFINKFLKKNPHVAFHTVGVRPDELMQSGLDRSLGDQVKVIPPVNPTMNYLQAINFDVWLAPYRNTEFNRCKFPTKALEAMFLGIPIIASNINGYRDAVVHGETGFIVKQPDHEWVKYMHQLSEDVELRNSMRKNAQIKANHYSTESLSSHWLKMIKEGPR